MYNAVYQADAAVWSSAAASQLAFLAVACAGDETRIKKGRRRRRSTNYISHK
jgi:hypothetical protein